MKDRTDLILEIVKETKADVAEVKERIHAIEKLDATQNVVLEDHTRRSLASEKRIEKIEDRQFKEKLFVGTVITGVVAAIEFMKRILI